nr:DUF6049 family protein [Pseudofrankia sp. BMG5.36]
MRRPAYLAVAVALTAALTGLPSVPSFASSTASTGLSTASSTGRTAAPASGASSSPGTSGAGAAAGSASAAAPRTSVVLDSYMPVASPGVPLSLSGHVDLAPSDSGQDLKVEVRVMPGGIPAAGGRARLEQARAKPTSVTYSAPLSDPVPVGPDHKFTLDAPLDQKVSKPQLTIYPMRVSVLRSGTLIAAAYTFLVWAPPQPSLKPIAVSTVLPISAPPKLRSDGMLTDDGLAKDIKPGGRLSRLLDALDPTSEQKSAVALALDPTLLKTLRVMAGRDTYGAAAVCTTVPNCYRFASPSGPREQPLSRDAATFLDRLSAFANTRGNTVFALPWGDVDLAALVRAGELNDVLWAVNTGRQVVAEALGHRDAKDAVKAAYPVDGLADPATLAFLAAKGVDVTTVIMDDRLLPAASRSATPTALTVQQTSAGPIRALAADSRLAQLVTAPEAESNEPKALGDMLAELAMITSEKSNQNRLAVLALPRDWNPSAQVAQQVLHALGSPANSGYQPFFQPTALPVAPVSTAGAASGAGDDSTGSTAPSAATVTAGTARLALTYPQWAADREIPTSYVDAVEHLRDEAALLDPVLCARIDYRVNPPVAANPATCKLRHDVIDPMKNTLLTALSVQWRANRPGAVHLSQEVDGRTNLIRNGVRVQASEKVTLTSREGTVPLTVNNISDTLPGNAFPMTVLLSVSSNDKTRLRSASTIPVIVQPGGVAQVLISVSSDAAGTFPVYIQVLTPDGKRLTTQPARILVRSTAYGTIATAITYVAVGLFAAAVLLRLVRRRRRRGAGPHGGDGPGEPLAGGPPIGEPPTMADGTRTDPDAAQVTDRVTTPVRRIQANAAGTQRTQSERAYAGGVPANPSEP